VHLSNPQLHLLKIKNPSVVASFLDHNTAKYAGLGWAVAVTVAVATAAAAAAAAADRF